MKKAFLIAFSSVLLLACSDIDNCSSDTNRTFVVLRFYDFETKESKSVGFRFIVEDSPYEYRFDADTTITPADTVTSGGEVTITPADTTIVSDSTVIGLPLNPLATEVTFLFDTDTIDHTLRLTYEKEYSIFDPDCDPSLVFVNIDTVRSTFDSTAIVGRVSNNQLATNFEIYL